MSFLSKPSLSRRFQLVLASFQQCGGLPFADVLSESQIEAAFAEEGALFARAEEDVYTPAVTLWGFLSQALFKQEQRSCLAAVSRIVVLLVALGRPRPSDNTGDYCRARAKLPERVIQRLALDAASRMEQQVPYAWLWHGRHVKLVDGTTSTAADTPANQAVWPQQPQQAAGLGFPILRIVVLLSLATAMVCGMALGPYAGKETSELALFRELLGQLAAGDILLADRYYCSSWIPSGDTWLSMRWAIVPTASNLVPSSDVPSRTPCSPYRVEKPVRPCCAAAATPPILSDRSLSVRVSQALALGASERPRSDRAPHRR